MPKFMVRIECMRTWFREVEANDAEHAEAIIDADMKALNLRDWNYELFAYSVNGEDF